NVFGGVGKGDQLVTVVVEIPTHVTDRQRALLEELGRELNEAHGAQTERGRFLDKLRGLFD
ncbi:MAG: hypothetical protein RL385_5597, partial [Pseudomonadota bacterium]